MDLKKINKFFANMWLGMLISSFIFIFLADTDAKKIIVAIMLLFSYIMWRIEMNTNNIVILDQIINK
jgi:hypothetical protein